MTTVTTQPMDGWNTIAWKEIQRHVFKLQTRIYRASSRGDVQTTRKLQRLLINSRSAKLLAVRRVTQDNQGKKTAGVDGVKALTPPQRLTLAQNLKIDHQAKPVRRVWIPKSGTDEQRPLGIPTIHDRALQTLVKAALEPEWEARFEPNSYGFRPGRLRTAANAPHLAGDLRRLVRSVNPVAPVSEIRTMDAAVAASTLSSRSLMWLFISFGAAALTLAAVWAYGVVSYSTAQRTYEMGVRVALGATRANIFSLVLGQVCGWC
jgi:hypothetical protein